MRKYLLVLVIVLLGTISVLKAAPNACFSASSGQSFPVAQCGAFFIQLNNCSTGTYDSAIWKLQISTNTTCNGPWGISFITAKGGAAASTGTGYSLTVYGSYRLTLTLIDKTTGLKDSFTTCIAKVYPIPAPNFTASDTISCGSLTTTFTPNISSGTAPFGPITWFYGDNQTQTVAGATPVTHTYACKNTFPPCYTVTISVVDVHGCTKVVSKPCFVNVPCNPVATLAVTGGNTCVAPSVVNLHASATSLIGAGIYSWWFPPSSFPPFTPVNGPSTSAQNVQHSFNTFGCHDVIVAIKDSITGCADTTQLSNAVCLQGVTVTSMSATTTQVCCGNPFIVNLNASSNPTSNPACVISGVLIATPVGVGGSPITLGTITSAQPYSYVIPCGTSSPVVYNICFQNNEVKNLCNNCTVTYNGCFQITVMPKPTAHINLTAPTQASYCSAGHNFCFDASTPANNLPGTTYQWWVGSILGSPLSSTTTFCNTFTNFGNFKIYLKTCQSAANGGCCAIDSITVSQQKPSGGIIVNKLNGCDSFYSVIKVLPSTDSLYTYNFGDGTPNITTTSDTVHHFYQCSIDTCYTLKVTHTAHAISGFACVDTITLFKAIKIGHKMTPVITMAPPIQCLIKKQACVFVNPNVPGLIPPPNSSPSCALKVCHWYFTKPDDVAPVAQSFVCDSPKVCFDDTGHFDAHYVIVNNGCADTLINKRVVVINGIIGNFTDSLQCSNSGSLANMCVTFKSTFKVYPPPTDSTHITFIVSGGTCGPPTYYNFVVAPNGAYPKFTHCFCNTATYTVTMITSNLSNFCPPDTTRKTVVVFPIKAQIDLVPPGASLNQCYPYNFCFSSANSLPTAPPPPNITWNFGDNKKSTARNPCHTYDTCGTYTVKLIVANASKSCVDSTTKVVSLSRIYPSFTITQQSNSCSVCYIITNNTKYCGGMADSTYFAFGDGTSQVFHGAWTSVVHCYKSTPPGNMYYSIFDTKGCNVYGYYGTPNINGIRACMSGWVDTVVCIGTTVNFTDCSDGLISNRCWTVSAGGCRQNTTCVSTSANYSYSFVAPGVYYIGLRLDNYQGCLKDTCIRIRVQNPTATFTGKDSIACPGSFDTLTNTTVGAYDKLIVSMSSPSIGFYQTFTYYKNQGGIPNKVALPIGYPADYKICWNAVSATGCSDSICKNLHVAGPIGHLNCSDVYACVGDTVCCQLVTNSLMSPIIKFSDGSFQVLPYTASGIYNFCHKYTFPGHQLVQAFIDDGIGCSYPVQDTVHIDGPIANFSWTPYIRDFCGKGTVTMIDSSLATLYPIDGTKYRWKVYDASGNVFATYNTITPTVTIAVPGTYSMELAIQSTFGCTDTLLLPFIRIHPYPTAAFTISPDTICINQCSNFTNTSINPDTLGGYKWYLGFPNLPAFATTTNAQYCFTAGAGLYNVVLIDSSKHGCIDTSAAQTILVLPSLTAAFTTNTNLICGNSGAINFTSTSIPNSGITWEWRFGDGSANTPAGNQSSVTHVFSKLPSTIDTCYTVKLIIRNVTGCVDSVTHQVCVSAAPHAGLVISNKKSCHPLAVSFTDNSISQANITGYYLDFGDGSAPYNSAIKPINLAHTFTNTSNTLTRQFFIQYRIVSQYGCIDSLKDTLLVYPIPAASFSVNNDSICGNTGTINFTSNSTPNTSINFTWNWNDGTPATGPGNFPNPNHVFTLPNLIGDTCYQPQLILSNQFTCADTSNTIICISAIPEIHLLLGPQSSCNPLNTSFTDSTISIVAINNYQIDFADFTNYSSAVKPNNLPKLYTNLSNTFVANYITTYKVTTAFGCSISRTDTFNIYPIPVACAGNNISVCPGEVTKIGCLPIAGMFYNWYNPVGSSIYTPSNMVANPAITAYNPTTYYLQQTNVYGCADSASVTINLKGLTVPLAGHDTAVCEGSNINLYAKGGINYEWYQLSNNTLIGTDSMVNFNAEKTDSFLVIIYGDCDTARVNVYVFVFDPPSVNIKPLASGGAIIAGRKVVLEAAASTNLAHFKWTPSVGIVGSDSALQLTVLPEINSTYTISMTDAYGCKDSAEISIFVLCDKNNSIYVPNAFEPNQPSSNINSRFFIQGTGVKEVVFLRIYNRWGDQVFNREHFAINDPDLGWDGTANGVKVGNDVYMYQMQILCSNGTLFPIAGNLTVIK
jgi:PKD repeat protein